MIDVSHQLQPQPARRRRRVAETQRRRCRRRRRDAYDLRLLCPHNSSTLTIELENLNTRNTRTQHTQQYKETSGSHINLLYFLSPPHHLHHRRYRPTFSLSLFANNHPSLSPLFYSPPPRHLLSHLTLPTYSCTLVLYPSPSPPPRLRPPLSP